MKNKPIHRKPIIYRKHALKRMRERNITSEDIEAIRDSGRLVKETKGCLEYHLGKKGGALVAVFEEHPNEIVLITTWRNE